MERLMNMAYTPGDKLEWQECFEVDDPKVNEQHQRLFILVNSLIDACNNNEGRTMIGDALAFLANYVVEHFSYEEYLMGEYGLPGKEHHETLHEEFKEAALGLKKSYDTNGASDELCEALKSVVSTWLVTHILEQDLNTFAHLT